LKFTKDWQVIGGTQLIREFKQTKFLANDDGQRPAPVAGNHPTLDLEKKNRHRRRPCALGLLRRDLDGEPASSIPPPGRKSRSGSPTRKTAAISGHRLGLLPGRRGLFRWKGLGVYEKETTLAPAQLHAQAARTSRFWSAAKTTMTVRSISMSASPPPAIPTAFFQRPALRVEDRGRLSREAAPASSTVHPTAKASVEADGDSVVGKEGDSKPMHWVAVPKDATKTGQGAGRIPLREGRE